MNKRGMTGLLYRPDTDWLLVRLMTFDGSRHSLERLKDAEECARLARAIMDSAEVNIYADKPCDLIRVRVTYKGDGGVLYNSRIAPRSPYLGLRRFLRWLRDFAVFVVPRSELELIVPLRELEAAYVRQDQKQLRIAGAID